VISDFHLAATIIGIEINNPIKISHADAKAGVLLRLEKQKG
jgi:hypothetical protein